MFSSVYATKDFYNELLNSCCSLEFLKMDSMEHSSNIVLQNLCKRNGQTLTSLDLSECRWISKKSIQVISKHCTQLTDINLWCTYISQDAMDSFISGVSPNVKEVCLGGNLDTITDKQIENLVSRCNRITELDISDTDLTDASITSVVKHLKQSLEYLDIRNINISFRKALELKSMLKLRILRYGFKSWFTNALRKKLPHLRVNPEDGFGHF